MAEVVQAELITGVKITITPVRVGEEAKITIFEVEIVDTRTSPAGSWDETFGSREQLQAFIRGMEAASMMIGGIHMTRPPDV